jgi:predicted HicB family RNase H-like nuclease
MSALRGLKDMIRDVVEDMRAPADKKYSGQLSLRLPPDRCGFWPPSTLEAAEARISLSRHLNLKLASA